jgi:cytochrome b
VSFHEGAATVRTPLWDWPVRIIHWSFAVLIPALWWTAENGEMGWHTVIGTVLMQLVVIRVLWGFVGGSTARFSSFVRGPGAVFAHLRSPAEEPSVGHNPAGGWSVLALLGLMALQVALGLVAGDPDDGTTGPLNHLVSSTTAGRATELHGIVFYVILAMIALHLAAIVYYRVIKRDNLIAPMITGSKPLPASADGLVKAPVWRLIACIVVAWLVGWVVWVGAA